MGIVTRTGDDGTTGLWSGERVAKDDPRVEAYGTVDELDSFLGAAWHAAVRPETRESLEALRRDLFRVSASLASLSADAPDPVTDADVDRLESLVAAFEGKLGLKGFVVTGVLPASAALDVARAVARRAERRILSLSRSGPVPRPLMRYMNRLSDLLFALARWEEHGEGRIRYVR